MGCFDTVLAPCAACGGTIEFQSKGGDCCMGTYEAHDCPLDVASDMREGECRDCGKRYRPHVQSIINITAVPLD